MVRGESIPVIGGPVLGIIIGMILAFWARLVIYNEEIRYTSCKFLQTAIIVLDSCSINSYSSAIYVADMVIAYLSDSALVLAVLWRAKLKI